ncbi:GNAT family N-acetyltransferase [bacterium]|nr:GNAT family N-acetyltransferase [bacterium]
MENYHSLKHEHYKEVNDLYSLAFSKNRSTEAFEWEFLNAPAGEGGFGGSIHDDKITSTCAYIPIVLSNGNEIIRSGKVDNAATDPIVRGKGIFGKVMKAFITEISNFPDLKVLWAFPVPYLVKTHINSGIQWAGKVEKGMKVLPGKNLGNYISDNTIIKFIVTTGVYLQHYFWKLTSYPLKKDEGKYSVSLTDHIPEDWEAFWDSIKTNYGITLHRSNEYLNWRCVNNPYFKYEFISLRDEQTKLHGWIIITHMVLKKGSKQLKLGLIDDIIADESTHVINTLLENAINRLQSQNCDLISTWVSQDSRLGNKVKKAVKKFGFYVHPKFDFNLMASAVDDGLDHEYYHDVKNWYLTGLFSEGVQ